MKLATLTLCRNEERFIGFTGRVALQWSNHWVVLLHACTDNSLQLVTEIWQEFPGKVTILVSSVSNSWMEMEHRQWMLEEARTQGATHMAIVDADEMLVGTGLGMVRDHVEALSPGQFLRVPMRNLCDSLQTYRCDPSVWGNATTVLAFADRTDLHWSARDGGYQHHHRHPMNSIEGHKAYVPEVLHMQMVSRQHLLAKHAWYQMMERVAYPHLSVHEIANRYSMAPSRDGLQLATCQPEWFAPYHAWLDRLNPNSDASIWHLDECQRMLDEYGARYFEGLNLFGMLSIPV